MNKDEDMPQATLILASGSPRRREILRAVGARFRAIVPGVDESHGAGDPRGVAAELAARKARAVMGALPPPERAGAVVIGCDTVVDLDGETLEKPRDSRDAARMLAALSGREHLVHSGLAILGGEKELRDVVTTRVLFRDLRPEEIARYVASGEPSDKAGAYGAQGAGASFVREIRGDYQNVVGLPLCRLTTLLRENFGVDIFLQESD